MQSEHETILDPDLPIIDSHHHLRVRPNDTYLFDDLRQDLSSGHSIVATVVVECGTFYRASGPEQFRAIGETEFFVGVAAMFASGKYGHCKACSTIVAFADLRLGDSVKPVLEAQAMASGGRLRGIRNPVSFHAAAELREGRVGPQEGLLLDSTFRKGFSCLAEYDLSFDVWLYYTQLDELVDVARKFPDTTIILNHVGGPLGVGPFADRRQEVFEQWKQAMTIASKCPNIFVKIGGLGLPVMGFGFDSRAQPASSYELAEAWGPYVETTISLFGCNRCMFESNYPSDRPSGKYPAIWNALKRTVMSYSQDEKLALFNSTAKSIYRI